MSKRFKYCEDINLFIEDRIPKLDAQRQERTAKEIVHRLNAQPGLILADEVGMGKTFVALATAMSVHLSDKKRMPVVVMVPPGLTRKWERDFDWFKKKCLPKKYSYLKCSIAERSVQFLKLLDNPVGKESALILLTHGAMSRSLSDRWVKLAIIQRALYRRKNIGRLRTSLNRFAGKLLGLQHIERNGNSDLWEVLLSKDPSNWLKVLQKRGIDPDGNGEPENADDPVPKTLLDILHTINIDQVYECLFNYMPLRESQNFTENLKRARSYIDQAARSLWAECTNRLNLELPLLIFDEAHHLKNSDTRVSQLFKTDAGTEDADQVTKGAFASVFDKMLFLTATPFQLGHSELCSVLERFKGVNWNGNQSSDILKYQNEIDSLRALLDNAQRAALQLDRIWGTLKKEDIALEGEEAPCMEKWWTSLSASETDLDPHIQGLLKSFSFAKTALKNAEAELRKWVIRHIKPKELYGQFAGVKRRTTLRGDAILNGNAEENAEGIMINDDSLMPFLIASRAVACSPSTRPVFSEGLSSSYEAFLHTRQERDKAKDVEAALDEDSAEDENVERPNCDHEMAWYLKKIDMFLPSDGSSGLSHPKINATVNKALELWKKGEKVIVFCHYRATGRALRQYISELLLKEIDSKACEMLKMNSEEAKIAIDELGKKFFDPKNKIRKACNLEINKIIDDYSDLESHRAELVDNVVRMLRTPSFLVRFFPLRDHPNFDEKSVKLAFKSKDGSDLTFSQILKEFFKFLSKRCGETERAQFIAAVNSIGTGERAGKDVSTQYHPSESSSKSDRLTPMVRLANGGVPKEARQKMMLTFNTPFYPDILIASSVMSEGADLHLNCRYVIHHDLCWNPSNIEQRTGRVDRLGAKVEMCGQPINVFLPYVAETQDEKMYRVVVDRERWFKIIMGEKYKVDLKTTDKLAERLPLPLAAAEELMFKLDLDDRENT